MGKKTDRKRIANSVIFEELAAISLKYAPGMTLRQASEILSERHALNLPDKGNKVAVALALRPAAFQTPTLLKPNKPNKKRRRRDAGAVPKPQLEGKFRAFYDSWEWKRLSYDVKQERGRKCECCGATPPGVRIVTDHVKPIRHHWDLRLERTNLQVLCDDCNMGKGSRDDTDFRQAS